jgi:hypothetical protein
MTDRLQAGWLSAIAQAPSKLHASDGDRSAAMGCWLSVSGAAPGAGRTAHHPEAECVWVGSRLGSLAQCGEPLEYGVEKMVRRPSSSFGHSRVVWWRQRGPRSERCFVPQLLGCRGCEGLSGHALKGTCGSARAAAPSTTPCEGPTWLDRRTMSSSDSSAHGRGCRINQLFVIVSACAPSQWCNAESRHSLQVSSDIY